MNLIIKFKPCCDERPWLIIREGGEYSQHAYLKSKSDCIKVRHLIDINKYPYNKDFKIAMKRLLTEEEFKNLEKHQRYYNSNRGVRGKR
ncbi:hypothetical protein [Peptoniphilus lacydonensis]|uniref:hypothetical protein n=1 Tax=Peptoniphilus lacydonensis TaxID=1673725 RepID=UPI00258AB022|nr:hypothetical protein [Peptoniphilus lacydonensis]MDU5377328.1 hypothetical protein [Peptoniphilus lacydonensis]MDU5436221.1 hypothetical protein [Peptoniphilus lacydonensis]MDU7302121.1 hypothetical protein [Peptoniphilus lacydonensis]